MAKRKVTMKVREMRDADVQWISLVNRPANRIPFRVTKNEGKLEAGMIHLNRMFAKKSEKTGSSVAAFLIQKSDQDAILPRLKDAGFNTDNLIEQDGVVVVKQEDSFNESECVAVQLNERVGAMLSNVQKAFTPYREDSTSFNENLNKHGFYPSVNVAMGALDETVRNALMDADTVAEASTSISEALEQFSGYIVTLVNNLPEEAFTAMKLASDITEKSEDGEPTEETTKSEEPEAAQGEGSEEASKSEAEGDQANEESSTASKAEEDTAEKAEKSEAEDETSGVAEKSDDGEAGSEPAKKAEYALTQKMDAILEAMGNLTSKVDSIEKSQGELASRVDSVDRVAKAAQEAVEGTVSNAQEDHHETPNPMTAKKGEQDFWGGTGLDKLIQM